jgi:hypothetical protein
LKPQKAPKKVRKKIPLAWPSPVHQGVCLIDVYTSRMRRNQVASGSEAFLQSAQIDLDKVCETAKKNMVSGSAGAASLLIGN